MGEPGPRQVRLTRLSPLPSTRLWWGNSFWVPPPPPLPAPPWGGPQDVPQPGSHVQTALELHAAQGPQPTNCGVTQRRNGSPKPERRYILSATPSQLPRNRTQCLTHRPAQTAAGQVSRVCSGLQRCRWGWAAAKQDHPSCRRGLAGPRTRRPHRFVARGVSWRKAELHFLSTAPRWAEPFPAAAGCLRAHTHAHAHVQLRDFSTISVF